MKLIQFNLGKVLVLLILAVSFLAAGTGEESLDIISLSSSSELQQINPFYVTAGILSAWLGVLGMMCLYLEKIPRANLRQKRRLNGEG